MMRISLPGNKFRLEDPGTGSSETGEPKKNGFALLDALLCIFITGILLLVVQGSIGTIQKIAGARLDRTLGLIEEGNGFFEGGSTGYEN
jgi:hypothetical protein